MPESRAHKRHKRKSAGKRGRTEVAVNGRVDAITRKKVIEIERSGIKKRLNHSVKKLLKTRKRHKILRVPQKHLKAAQAVAPPSVTVTNLSKTKHRKGRKHR